MAIPSLNELKSIVRNKINEPYSHTFESYYPNPLAYKVKWIGGLKPGSTGEAKIINIVNEGKGEIMAVYGEKADSIDLKVEKAENGYVIRADGKLYVARNRFAMLNLLRKLTAELE